MTFIEVKSPKEIRQYKESIFFGLSARQCFCTILAVGIAAGVYLLLGPVIGRETASWLCILLPYRDDWLDHYREEANQIMKDRAAQSNNLVQERFVTLSIPQRKMEESRAYFRRAGANLQKTFARLDSGIQPARNYDRLRILHDFFRPGQEQYFDYDDYRFMQSGRDFRDLICPDSICFRSNHFAFGEKFGRVLWHP